MRSILKHKKLLLLIVWIFHLLMMLLFLSVSSYASWCEEISESEWESYPKREGYYVNCPSGYAITIPEGFVARGEAPSHTEHGFGILLSRKPDGYLWVDGSPNSLEWESPDQAANLRIEWIKEDAQKILLIQKSHLMLGTLPAIRLIIRYACPSARIIVNDYFLALDQRGLAYTIALSADDATYEEYKEILEDLAGTFHLIEASCK